MLLLFLNFTLLFVILPFCFIVFVIQKANFVFFILGVFLSEKVVLFNHNLLCEIVKSWYLNFRHLSSENSHFLKLKEQSMALLP